MTTRGSIHGRSAAATPAMTLAQLFPAHALPVAVRAHKGRTKHGKAGLHGRGRGTASPLPYQAKVDPWKHKDQMQIKGAHGVKR